MYECCIGNQNNLTSLVNNDHHNNGQPQPTPAEMPPSAAHKALRPAPSSLIDGRPPPEQADVIFSGVRGCMALNTLRCYGDASSPEQRSALRAIHPLNTPKIISNCSGGHCPSICRVSTRRTASCGALGGHFRRRQPWL